MEVYISASSIPGHGESQSCDFPAHFLVCEMEVVVGLTSVKRIGPCFLPVLASERVSDIPKVTPPSCGGIRPEDRWPGPHPVFFLPWRTPGTS